MRLGTFVFGLVCGAIVWWALGFIPAVDNFNNFSHEKVAEWCQGGNNAQQDPQQTE